MPNIRITSMEHTEKEAKSSGKVYNGLQIHGTQLVDQNNFEEKPWEKFVYDFDEAIDLFTGFGPGDEIKISNIKDGRFWKIVKVEHLAMAVGDGGQPGQNAGATAQTKTQPKAHPEPPVSSGPQIPVPPPISNCSCTVDPEMQANIAGVDFAVDLYGRLASANDKYKSLFKAAITPDVIEDMILACAGKFTSFIKGEDIPFLESDSKDLDKKPAEEGKQKLDDDIPF